MVMTISASFTASPALAAPFMPCSCARCIASALRSTAITSRPALAWLAAMPGPMLPSPMNATRVMLALPLEFGACHTSRRAPRKPRAPLAGPGRRLRNPDPAGPMRFEGHAGEQQRAAEADADQQRQVEAAEQEHEEREQGQ